ncbi:MAG TPA: hypothetical protein VE573_09670 [Nitrososphaeraceae archaeon]|nr:hypothetical protein [Nitrososphaeraceae archaeon]
MLVVEHRGNSSSSAAIPSTLTQMAKDIQTLSWMSRTETWRTG